MLKRTEGCVLDGESTNRKTLNILPNNQEEPNMRLAWPAASFSLPKEAPLYIKRVIATGGGKGGIGKSFISSSLAIAMAQQGQKVIAADLDFGGANLHTSLGVELPQNTVSDFLSQRTLDLSTCLTPTYIKNLSLLSGAQDSVKIADISDGTKARILAGLWSLKADVLILDLGAGTAHHTLDFFLASDVGIVTLLPEPTSIENAYRFIKSIYYRKLFLAPELAPVRAQIECAMDSKNQQGLKTPADLYKEINRVSPELGIKLKSILEHFRPKLLINQARTQTDIEIGVSVKSVCKRYFGIDLDYIGYLDYESTVWQSIRRKRPLLLEFPNSRLVSTFERIAQQITRENSEYSIQNDARRTKDLL
jgi:flagellar biosynthesis protein FlhG